MKGTVYGGVIYLPSHPASDINGLVRAVIRTKGQLRAEENLEAIGVPSPWSLWKNRIWSETHSAVEQLVTGPHYGRLLVCPLDAAYVTAEKYQPLEKQYFHPQETAGIPKTPVIASKSGARKEKF